ncbi:MBL fold metallo-hydrolase [Luteimonas kalidii]|uniref:MBL fold metallo-hydrolase n=1 Tax=Luteimonas kalidii TaxID=3042025 RepID=A0ABT6JX15_9GAMM|nr:MBL fold metallo-hydrolase [Luteimonas kalidii]MDH5835237.1 MBL fold metallo-hydrolase [Luteimonas kalidii]
MQHERIERDVHLFVGDAYQSVATAFVDGEDVLLVDALAGADDARWLRHVLCDQMGKTVRVIATTHFMSDHLAALPLFPRALVVAHRNHRQAFLSQNRREDAVYRDPEVVFDSALRIRWGRHELRLLHNPGKTMDHLSVDVPSADLVCAGDNIVGRIVYLSRADPAQVRTAIGRMRQFGRSTVVGGHIGRFGGEVLEHALHYLDRLASAVVAIRVDARDPDARIAAIALEDCLAPGVVAVAFEREWHQRNLEAIVAQSVFSLDAAIAMRSARA